MRASDLRPMGGGGGGSGEVGADLGSHSLFVLVRDEQSLERPFTPIITRSR